MFELNNLNAIKIGIASPEKIREWSRGEVVKSETINYRTHKPEMGGLLCERIFGPSKDWECHCGKYKRVRHKGHVCDKCGVEITRKDVRRERMGHIELAAPVTHVWFTQSQSSHIALLLNMKPKDLERVVYYVSYIVLDPGTTDFVKMQIINDFEYREAEDKFGYDSFKAVMGAEAIRQLLSEIDLEQLKDELAEEQKTSKGQKRLKLNKRLELVSSMLKSGNKPEWLVLQVIPVIPPETRPMIQLDSRFVTSDINDLYRRIINRNNRLKKFLSIGAPDVIVRNEKRMLQESVDALIDNGRHGKAVQGPRQRELKSLSQSLKSKNGRFRLNLLGKRVDYSGRSVIVIGPELKMYQCGLPKEMALELFRPFIMNKLVARNLSLNMKSAKRAIESRKPVIWDILEEVIKDHPVMLNRAPSLHRLSIQAFEPVLVEGRAIRLHPLVCAGYNADFDGDQMSVHVPLSPEAIAEARLLLLSSNNVLRLADSKSIVTPSQDIVLGCYYLTYEKPGAKGEGKYFADQSEAVLAFESGVVDLQASIFVRRSVEIDGVERKGRIKTTVGRIIFNQAIPQNIGIVDRSIPENFAELEVNYLVGRKELDTIVESTFNTLGTTETVKMLDQVKEMGYKYSTLAAVTINVFDMITPSEKYDIVAETEKKVEENTKHYERGFITEEEKIDRNISLWNSSTERIKNITIENLHPLNPIKMMAQSGARGNPSQIMQLCGMRGISATTSGKRVDIPVKSNFRIGLNPLEFFLSARGGRKGLVDKGLKTADAGYFTRRLVFAAQDIVVTEEDCFVERGEKLKGIAVSEIINDKTRVASLIQRISGRVAVEDVINPKTKKVIVNANEMITQSQAKEIDAAGITKVNIRTVLTCRAKEGVCAKCYGKNMANNNLVHVGEAVGIIAAQSIGEPGTQLTMRTFHTGGVAGVSDITKGLPRVMEVFDNAREPKGRAVISDIAGKVSIKEIESEGRTKNKYYEVFIKGSDSEVRYEIPFGVVLKIKHGDVVEAGQSITEGSIALPDLLRTRGVRDVQKYILQEILSIYSQQGVSLNTKHIEIIIKQMLRNVTVEHAGDTKLVAGEVINIEAYEEENERVIQEGGMPATAKRLVLGLKGTSLSRESFLTAASFQETSKVLTDAAIKGKVDYLKGLKENLMIGKRIPAGTGFKAYKDVNFVEVDTQREDNKSVSEDIAKFFDENVEFAG